MKVLGSRSKKIEVVDGPGVKNQLVEMFADDRTKYICIACEIIHEVFQ